MKSSDDGPSLERKLNSELDFHFPRTTKVSFGVRSRLLPQLVLEIIRKFDQQTFVGCQVLAPERRRKADIHAVRAAVRLPDTISCTLMSVKMLNRARY